MHYTPVSPYRSKLTLRQTQQAIKIAKDTFEAGLSRALCLDRVTAPLMVTAGLGINDDLSGVERKVTFPLRDGTEVEIVQSLAKWKRMQLGRFGYREGEGLYTDMNAIRRDEEPDALHAVLVDQWDWELVIGAASRTRAFLEATVRRIVGVLADTKEVLRKSFPCLTAPLCRDVYFITAEALERTYPHLTPKERENVITREHGTVFIEGIGEALPSGKPHDSRAPDYDDWSLNGDLLAYSDVLGCSIEISSMGIRVDGETLLHQLQVSGTEDRLPLAYHRGVIEGKYPLTVGGGIGQSRLCMLLLEKAHIGEVLASVWPESERKAAEKANIYLL